MIGFSLLALLITSASAAVLPAAKLEHLWNPEYLLGLMTSAQPPPGMTVPLIESALTRGVVAVIAVFGIVVATLSVNIAANIVGPANDFANLNPKRISFQTGGLITGVIGILMMPWKLMADPATYLGGWLGGVGMLLGPVAAIMIADYWVVRKRELDVRSLFLAGGPVPAFNPVALWALALAVAPNLPGFFVKIKLLDSVPAVFTTIYPYGWFSGVTIAFVVYVVGSRLQKAVSFPS